jgi:hypothetical protein
MEMFNNSGENLSEHQENTEGLDGNDRVWLGHAVRLPYGSSRIPVEKHNSMTKAY